MSDIAGYVVIEYNQASGMPGLADDTVYDDAEEAAAQADEYAASNRVVGRRETFAIGTIYIEED